MSMKLNLRSKSISYVGDVHGDWFVMMTRLTNLPRNSICIQVGDFGLGFKQKSREVNRLEMLNSFLSNIGVTLLVIRGNHDDPSYFDGNYTWPNLKLLKDGTIATINDKEYLFVGGAISVDREKRVVNQSWWKNEVVDVELIDRIIEDQTSCDVLVCHTAPQEIGTNSNSFIKHYFTDDPDLEDQLMQERKHITRLVKAVQPKEFYCGHFHESLILNSNDCRFRILDINEMYMKYEQQY